MSETKVNTVIVSEVQAAAAGAYRLVYRLDVGGYNLEYDVAAGTPTTINDYDWTYSPGFPVPEVKRDSLAIVTLDESDKVTRVDFAGKVQSVVVSLIDARFEDGYEIVFNGVGDGYGGAFRVSHAVPTTLNGEMIIPSVSGPPLPGVKPGCVANVWLDGQGVVTWVDFVCGA